MKSPLLYTTLLTAAMALPFAAAQASGVDAGMPVRNVSAVGSTVNIENSATISADLDSEASAVTAATIAPAAGHHEHGAEHENHHEHGTDGHEGAGDHSSHGDTHETHDASHDKLATDADDAPAVDAAIEAAPTADTNADSAAGTTATDAVNDSPVAPEATEEATSEAGDDGAANGESSDTDTGNEDITESEGAGIAVPDTSSDTDEAESAAGTVTTDEALTEQAADETEASADETAGQDALPTDDDAITTDLSSDDALDGGFDAAIDVTTDTIDPMTALAEADYAASHTVGDVTGLAVIGANGKKLGQLAQIVASDDEQTYAVVKNNGFLGLGRKEVLVPLEVMTLDTADKKIVLSGTSTLNGYEQFKDGNYTAIAESDPLDTLDIQLQLDTEETVR